MSLETFLGGAAGGAAGRSGSIFDLLAPLDYPRQALWNIPAALSKGDILGALPGLLGGAAGLGLAATGAGLPLALLGGSLTGGAAQALGRATGSESFDAPTPSALVAALGMDPESLPGMGAGIGLGLAGDPLTYVGGLFGQGAARAARNRALLAEGEGLGGAARQAELETLGRQTGDVARRQSGLPGVFAPGGALPEPPLEPMERLPWEASPPGARPPTPPGEGGGPPPGVPEPPAPPHGPPRPVLPHDFPARLAEMRADRSERLAQAIAQIEHGELSAEQMQILMRTARLHTPTDLLAYLRGDPGFPAPPPLRVPPPSWGLARTAEEEAILGDVLAQKDPGWKGLVAEMLQNLRGRGQVPGERMGTVEPWTPQSQLYSQTRPEYNVRGALYGMAQDARHEATEPILRRMLQTGEVPVGEMPVAWHLEHGGPAMREHNALMRALLGPGEHMALDNPLGRELMGAPMTRARDVALASPFRFRDLERTVGRNWDRPLEEVPGTREDLWSLLDYVQGKVPTRETIQGSLLAGTAQGGNETTLGLLARQLERGTVSPANYRRLKFYSGAADYEDLLAFLRGDIEVPRGAVWPPPERPFAPAHYQDLERLGMTPQIGRARADRLGELPTRTVDDLMAQIGTASHQDLLDFLRGQWRLSP
jgi:hypothetical protein